MNKYEKLLSDAVLFAISSFASKILVFLLLPFYTNVLTTEEYAIADLITVTINLFLPIFTLSISEATLRFVLDKDTDNSEVLHISFFVVSMSSLLMFISLPIIGKIYPTINEYWLYFIVLYFCISFHNLFLYWARGVKKMRVFAISGIVQTITILLCNILFLLVLKIGLSGYLLSMILSYIISISYMICVGKLQYPIGKTKLNGKLFNTMIKYSLPMIPTIIAWWFMQTSDKYMVIYKLGLSESGIYSVSYKIPSILSMITALFTQAWQIAAISNYGKKDNNEFVGNVYKYYNLVSVISCAILILMSKPLGYVLYAKDYFIAWKCVPILLVAYVFSGLSGLLASVFTASMKTKYLFVSTSIGAIANVAINLFIIDCFGIIGAAYSTLIAFGLTWIIRFFISKKIIDVDIRIFKHLLMYMLLIIESVLIYKELNYSYLFSLLIIFVLIIVNSRDIYYVLSILSLKLSEKLKMKK